jgi:hypothetical protein
MNKVKNKMRLKILKYDRTINYLSKLIKVNKEKIYELLLKPEWFEKFWFYGFNLREMLENDKDVLSKFKNEANKIVIRKEKENDL